MRRNEGLGGFLLAVALLSPAAAALQASPSPSAAPAEVDPFQDGRARRIEREAAFLRAESAAVAAFGGEPEFATALEAIRDACRGQDWWKSPEGPFGGLVHHSAYESWLVWNRPEQARPAPVALDFEIEGHPYATIVDLSRQLTSRGFEFLYVSFPTRLQCYPEIVLPELKGAAPFAGMLGANPAFLLELSKAGVEVLDLSKTFVDARVDESDPKRRLLYLRSNMHWTPRGAELAAKAVAERLAEMPWFKQGPYKEGRTFDVVRRDVNIEGDGNGGAPGAEPESVGVNRIQMRGPPLQNEAARQGPIVLLGDSYSWFHRTYQGSFQEHLFRFTGSPIDMIAPAGGTEIACRDALRRRGDGLREKKVVVWLMQQGTLMPSRQFTPVDVFRK